MMNNEQQQRSDYLYVQHVTHLTLQGKRPATIDDYSRALRRITLHLDKSPDTLTTEDLKRYLAQRITIIYGVPSELIKMDYESYGCPMFFFG
ncbi:phage integrase N-terminal SAM-like domain-containing protein [Photobacterium carnosum]|uniref:phage integrase N-terminal SAM-like domain-containing protein n=1 Tax=Photobacterium carnosum TaxID=2023717 RepID=UPI0038B3E014